jgi:predicted O-methyltransferase YrrM
MRPPRKPKRYTWLIDQIQQNNYSVGAEVGCAKGNTTARLLAACPYLKLYCVDMWAWSPQNFTEYSKDIYKDWDFKEVRKTFRKQTHPYKRRITELRGLSWEMPQFVYKELDFVFIDADHGYESVLQDIKAWTPKLKAGGLLSGHDINLPSVQKAVEELIDPAYINYADDNVWWCYKEAVDI